MYSKRGYLMLSKETSAGTAVYPAVGVEYTNETISVNKPVVPSNVVAGTRSSTLHANRGVNEAPTGGITIEVGPNEIGYFLTGVYGAPSTTGPTDTDAYTHVFTHPYNATHPTFTVDVAVGEDHIRRYVGCKFHNINFGATNNVITAEITTTALYEFVTTQLSAATTATDTTLEVGQTAGLTTSDTLVIGEGTANEEEKAITSITDGNTVVVAATTKDHALGDIICIKRQVPSYTRLKNFILFGSQNEGASIKIGDAIGTVATRCYEQFGYQMGFDVEPRYCADDVLNVNRYPKVLLDKQINSSVTLQEYFKDYTQTDKYDYSNEQAVEIEFTGELAGATTVRSSLKIQVPKAFNNQQPIQNAGADEIINEALALDVYYDSTAGYESKITLINQVVSY